MVNHDEYLRIMKAELNLEPKIASIPTVCSVEDVPFIEDIAHRILAINKSSTVPRCFCHNGNLTTNARAYESVGAHANLTRALVEYALDFWQGWTDNLPHYTRRIFSEAMLVHDLLENETGDKPDNKLRQEYSKFKEDFEFFREYSKYYEHGGSLIYDYAVELLDEMYEQRTVEGRICYLADKTSAIINNLTYDSLRMPPHAKPNDIGISDLNRKEMKLCDIRYKGGYLLSEVWTINYFVSRRLQKFDDTGFFTALLVMVTLLTRGKWYKWRNAAY